jgi:ribonuclease HII
MVTEFNIPYELECEESLIAGVDEVGRGALCGLVVAAAAIVPKSRIMDLVDRGVKDSKKLPPKRREQLAIEIQQCAIAYQIGVAAVGEIDRVNILQATLLAMQRAVTGLSVPAQLCLVDGNQSIPHLTIPQQTLVKGEDRSIAIACASILAKVYRDRLMVELAKIYPLYDLEHNKGYGTTKHLAALAKYGACPEHRRSFSPVRDTIAKNRSLDGIGSVLPEVEPY